MFELLKKYGLEIPQEKQMAFNDEFNKLYTGTNELSDLQQQHEAVKQQLKGANKEITNFKNLDIEGVKRAADDWKLKYEKEQKDSESKIADIKFNHAIENALSTAKAKNTKAVKALLDFEGLKLTNDGAVGLNEQLTKIKEDNDFMFENETQGRYAGHTPGGNVQTQDKKGEANTALRAVFGKGEIRI